MGASAGVEPLTVVPPLFIGGCGRSGTTLLTDLLGCHSQLSPIYEPWFLFDIANLIFVERTKPVERRLELVIEEANAWIQDLENLPHDKKAYERYRHGQFNIHFTAQTVQRETERLCKRLLKEPSLIPFRDYILALFAEHARLDQKAHWVSKVPRYVLMAPLLKQAMPAMRFIHCVRDPRTAIASMSSRTWAPKTLNEQIEYWRVNVERGAEFTRRFPSDSIEIRYEDLTDDPAATLSKIFRWLHLPDEAVSIVEDYQREFPISRNHSRPRSEVTESDLSLIHSALGNLMRQYRYLP
jgi:hypothetical protein